MSAFLCRITRNLALKKYEQYHVKKRNHDIEVSLSELNEVLSDKKDIVDEIEIKELGDIINIFLRSLPSNERNIFIRRYWLFHKIKRIALDFGCSQSNIKYMLARTRKKLSDYLNEHYFGEGDS